MPHLIEIFVGGCSLCKETVDIAAVGKCKDCRLLSHDLSKSDADSQERIKSYNISSVPAIIIDSRIKVVGTPTFPWFYSDDFYNFLESRYPLTMDIHHQRH